MPIKKELTNEWGNAHQVFQRFGLTKGRLYKLADAGRIKWTVVKTDPGNQRGTRLFNMGSIRELLEVNARCR
jgi:hypothetical protein